MQTALFHIPGRKRQIPMRGKRKIPLDYTDGIADEPG